jgi:hypothetical protein
VSLCEILCTLLWLIDFCFTTKRHYGIHQVTQSVSLKSDYNHYIINGLKIATIIIVIFIEKYLHDYINSHIFVLKD